MYGVAREVAALTGVAPPHPWPELAAIEVRPGPLDPDLGDPALCRHGFGSGLAKGTQHALFVSTCHLERAPDSSYVTLDPAQETPTEDETLL